MFFTTCNLLDTEKFVHLLKRFKIVSFSYSSSEIVHVHYHAPLTFDHEKQEEEQTLPTQSDQPLAACNVSQGKHITDRVQSKICSVSSF